MTQLETMTSGRAGPPSRRQFLGRCSACAAGALCLASHPSHAFAAQNSAAAPGPAGEERARVRLVFSHPLPKEEGWPYLGYDFEGRKAELTSRLRSACPNIDFLPAAVRHEEDCKKLLETDSEVDGYVLYLLGLPASPAAIAASGRPVIAVNDLYGGGHGSLRGPRVVLVSSSDFNDVVQTVRTFEVIRKLRSSTIVDVVDGETWEGKAVEEAFGAKSHAVSSDDLNVAYSKADASEAQKWAKTWMRNAQKIVEPSAEEIGKSGRMFVAMRDLMSVHHAQGIAVDCLGLFYAGRMAAYPCLGFFQLNNDGLVGACEADLQSAITMLAMTYLTGRPGYISDPVIDTSKNQVIYAHCVAPSKVFGPGGPTNPYHIRSHSEDRKGAAVRSLLPLGQTVTSLKFVPSEKRVVMHLAKTVANIDDDKACRTKLAAEIPNARKLLAEYSAGWHRVTVYGDHKERVHALGTLLGFKVIEEG